MKNRAAILSILLLCGLRSAALDSSDHSLMSDAYLSIWNDAEQARIDEDIEANRKADGTFDVSAPDGADVKVEQISHDFRFGAHIFNFNQLGKKEYNDAYKASYGDGGLFNQATVAFYWKDYEPVPGRFRSGGDYEDTERFWNSVLGAYYRKKRAEGHPHKWAMVPTMRKLLSLLNRIARDPSFAPRPEPESTKRNAKVGRRRKAA